MGLRAVGGKSLAWLSHTNDVLNRGLFITFEGIEGCGKSTQLKLLAERLRPRGYPVLSLREPGGTPIGEEIRHTLQHSRDNAAMTAEAEMLLMNASRAQLVREVIKPALGRGEIILCDRFYHSTLAYQGYGRELNLEQVRSVVDFAVADARPDLVLLLEISLATSDERRRARASAAPVLRDRIEEAGAVFFGRVARGYQELAAREPGTIHVVDAQRAPAVVAEAIWKAVELLLPSLPAQKK